MIDTSQIKLVAFFIWKGDKENDQLQTLLPYKVLKTVKTILVLISNKMHHQLKEHLVDKTPKNPLVPKQRFE